MVSDGGGGPSDQSSGPPSDRASHESSRSRARTLSSPLKHGWYCSLEHLTFHPCRRFRRTARRHLSAPDGLLARSSKLLKNFDPNNLGSVYAALSTTFPDDRFGYPTYQQDKLIAAYYYRPFVRAIIAAPDDATKDALALPLFDKELDGIKQAMNPLPNFGYYMPWARSDFMDNHQVTAISFTGSGIHENGVNADVGDFVNDLLNQKDPADTPVMKAFRTEQWSDFTFSTFLTFIDSIFNLSGEAGPISTHPA